MSTVFSPKPAQKGRCHAPNERSRRCCILVRHKKKTKQLERKYHAATNFPNEKQAVVLADRDYFKTHSKRNHHFAIRR